MEQSPSWEASRFQLVKEFPAFYGTRSFIITFISARHLSLSWARSIQFIIPHPTSWWSIPILFFYLGQALPSDLFPSGFPTKTLYTTLFYPIRATCTAYLIFLDLITRKIIGQMYRHYVILSTAIFPERQHWLNARNFNWGYRPPCFLSTKRVGLACPSLLLLRGEVWYKC